MCSPRHLVILFFVLAQLDECPKYKTNLIAAHYRIVAARKTENRQLKHNWVEISRYIPLTPLSLPLGQQPAAAPPC